MHEIIDKLIIVAGQWKRFGGLEYEQEFSNLLNELSRMTGTTPEGALNILLADLGGTGVAA